MCFDIQQKYSKEGILEFMWLPARSIRKTVVATTCLQKYRISLTIISVSLEAVYWTLVTSSVCTTLYSATHLKIYIKLLCSLACWNRMILFDRSCTVTFANYRTRWTSENRWKKKMINWHGAFGPLKCRTTEHILPRVIPIIATEYITQHTSKTYKTFFSTGWKAP